MSAPHLVLVVEDDPPVAEFLQLALRAMGHEAIVAVDGHEALAMAAERPPQFVLLDALLPKLDGFGVLRELRKTLPQVPIVMMSGIYQKRSYVQETVDLGAREYLFKPLSVLRVWELAERYLGEAAPGASDPAGFAGTPLSERPLACVLADILQERSTGMLFVRGPEGTAILFAEDGRIIFGRSNDAETRLDRVLESQGKLGPDARLQARRLLDQAKGRARLGDLLVDAGLLEQADLEAALDKQQRLHVTRPLTWTEGRSQFFLSETPRQESFKLDLDTEALVVWAARHLSSGPALEAWLPPSRSMVHATRDLNAEAARFSLTQGELELLSLADGTRSLGALRAMGRLAQVDVDRVAAALCSLGVLEAKDEGHEPKTAGAAAANAPAAGAVSTHPPARVLLGTSLAGKTGSLRFENGAATGTVWFGDGCVAFANSNDPQNRLGQVLLRSNFVTGAQLRAALETAKATPGAALGRILVDQGTLTLDDLHGALVAQVREVVAGLVCWREGTFNFTTGRLPTQEIVPLDLDPLALVLEALRTTPFTSLAAVLPDRNSRLRKTWQCFELAAEIDLTQLEDRLLCELDANPRVGSLLDVLGEDPQASLRAMHLLHSLGLLEEQPGAAGDEGATAGQSSAGGPSKTAMDDGFADEEFGSESFGHDEPSAADPGFSTIPADAEQSFAGLADEPAFHGLIEAGSTLDPQPDFASPTTGREDGFASLADEPAPAGLIEASSARDPQPDFGSPVTGNEDSFAGLGDELPAAMGRDLFAGELRGETGFTAAIDIEPQPALFSTEETDPPSMGEHDFGADLSAAFAQLEGAEAAPSANAATATATREASIDPALQGFLASLADHLRAHPGTVPEHVLATLPPELRERFGI